MAADAPEPAPEELCCFCKKSFNVVFIDPCAECSRLVCFTCQTFTSPTGFGAFCRDCAYQCAAPKCEEIIWPGSVFKLKDDVGRLTCVHCRATANVCAIHQILPPVCCVGAADCPVYWCAVCAWDKDSPGQKYDKHCADHTVACSSCHKLRGCTSMYWCASDGCDARFCEEPLHKPCYSTALGDDDRSETGKCYHHLHTCSCCMNVSEPHSPLSSVLENKKLCETCTQDVTDRVNAVVNVLGDKQKQVGDDIKRLLALHLVDAERRAREERGQARRAERVRTESEAAKSWTWTEPVNKKARTDG